MNPPIVPKFAVIEPDISIPAADADRAVLLEAVFISNESELMLTCLPDVEPIVVVAAKLASCVEPSFKVIPSELADICLEAAKPILVIVPKVAAEFVELPA